MSGEKALPARILLVKPSSLGDIIHTLPLAHALKRCAPDCSIGWVVEEAFQEILLADASIETVYPIRIPSTSNPGADSRLQAYWQAFVATSSVLLKLRKILKKKPYTLVFDLQASFRSGLLAMMNPRGKRIGFADARELNTFFQHEKISVPEDIEHALDKNLLFAQVVHCEVIEDDFHLDTSKDAEAQVEIFLRESGIHKEAGKEGKDVFVYAQPAARWQSKQWLVNRWSELADRLQQAGIRVVFGGSKQDISMLQTIEKGMLTPAIHAAGRLRLGETAALLKKAAAYVGVDTGPMHMAALTGTPVVALFGPTHPERVGPYGTKSRVLQADGLDCLCCRKRYCTHQRCMHGLSVERVFASVIELTQKRRG